MKIKDTYVGIAILIAIISIIFFISISQKNTNNTENTQISYQNELIKDSIKREYTKKIISIRDSLIMVSEQNIKQASEKTNLLKKQIGGLKQENSRLRVIYSENHTLQNCDSLLSNQTEITNKQDSSILSLSNEVYELNNINHHGPISLLLDAHKIVKMFESARGNSIGETGINTVFVGNIFHLNESTLFRVACHNVEPAIVDGNFPADVGVAG